MFDIITQYREGIMGGLQVTLQMCLIIWSSGIVIGAILGTASSKWKAIVGWPLRAGTFILSGLPVLVLLFWVHYPLQSILNITINPFYTAVAVLSAINIFGIAELVRGALDDFPVQYVSAAKVCGLNPRDIAMYIQLPIILRQLLPGLLTLQVAMLQATLFASLISVEEIFRVAQRINAQVYRPIPVYTAL